MIKSRVITLLLSTLVLTVVLYYLYWVIVGLLDTQVKSLILVEAGLSSVFSQILMEVLYAVVVGPFFGFSFAVIVKEKQVLLAFLASMLVFFILVFENNFAVSWLHLLSYFLMVLSVTFFALVGSKVMKRV